MRPIGFPAALLAAALCIAASAGGAVAQDRTERLIRQAGDLEKEEPEEKPKTELVKVPARSSAGFPRLEKAVDPSRYVLGPYDRLLVEIVGPETRSFELIVLPEGDVLVPRVGALRADGLTISQFRDSLIEVLEEHFRNVEIFCYLLQPRTFRVFVTGEVADPGAVDVTAVQRVSDAVDFAGSILSQGSNRNTLLIRDGDTTHVDILRYTLEGDFSTNPYLSNGDRIHVPVAGPHAIVLGSVVKSQVYEILEGETIADLIDLAGGFTAEAVTDTVLVTRIGRGGTVRTLKVPSSEYDMDLQDRDEIHVMDGMTGAARVYVFGATPQTGHYYITEGDGLRSLLGRISVFDPDADLSAASLETSEGEIMKIDLRDYITNDSDKDIALDSGDILHVPSVTQVVSVGGEVQMPSRIEYVSGWTVAQYVGASGGPTREGSMDRILIISEDGRSRNVGRKAVPESGDVIIVRRSRSSIFGEWFGGLIGVGTLIISIVALTQ